MSLQKHNPELVHLKEDVDRFFTRAFGGLMPLINGAWSPSVDVEESNGNLIVKADLPGIKKEDVDISATKDAVTIEAHSAQETEEKQPNFYYQERRSGHFLRVVPLPATIDVDKTEAVFQDGTLTLTLPKVGESTDSKGHKIPIK